MLIDTFGRTIDYLRVSVTKQCNFRCQYCMPHTPKDFVDKSALPLPQMLEFIKIAIDNGIKKICITGGEPLLRADLSEFIGGIFTYKKDIEITLTTNAFFLYKYAASLKDAGLSRINISLDSLKPQRIKEISQCDALPQILKGIDEAHRVGLGIKINMVPLLGINDDEIIDILEFGKQNGYLVRFIEFMENTHANAAIKGLSSKDILRIIATKYSFELLQKEHFGPAKIYALSQNTLHTQKAYAFGIISPHEDDFCQSCNRIRLTSDGIICPCLYYQESVSLKEAILANNTTQMQKLLEIAIKNKPEKNQWDTNMVESKHSARAFYYTGG